jgi:expansin (peptidoglycan-binding protein)
MSPKLCKERPNVDIDLSAGAFKKIADKSKGKIAVIWREL